VLARCFNVCRYEAQLLSLLIEKPSVLPREMARLYSSKHASVPKLVVHRLRTKLKRKVPIRSKRNLGYWIEPTDKARILKQIIPQAAA
jgi:hypothetical protein